ncbi:MAG: prolyl oligopeptidase family serine peptidase [Kiritimatiellae bacterium]|nr:prolyl oligopeptidase family serine peptidase [Kiritimatiellia bacterium]
MKTFIPRVGYGHMALDYVIQRVKDLRRERAARLGAIRTREQAVRYRESVRRTIRAAFALAPAKTPLNARITGTIRRNGYRIEKVIFESRPGCLVTGNLYLPAEIGKPCPGVVSPCGHSANGKAYPSYQEVYQRLVHAGFVVLAYDPFNQGERDQYFHLPKLHPLRANCCAAHNMMGKQLELIGEYFGMWRAWDGIRALDYLLTRPEVDARRVGVTGNSGGGTLTTWLWAIEERFAMAAPNCFITTFLRNLENEIPADCEQYPPGVLGAGLEMADFLIARAPEPIVLLGERQDFFDLRGLREAYADVRRFYSFFDAEDKAAIFVGTHGHGYYPESQRAMVRFFCGQSGMKPPASDPVVRVEKDALLLVTPQGQVIPAGAKPIFKMIGEKADTLVAMRKVLSASALRGKARTLLALPSRTGAPRYRILRAFSTGTRPDFGRRLVAGRPALKGEIIFSRFAIETEGEIRAILKKRVKAFEATLSVEKTIALYLPHVSSEEDMASDGLARTLMARGPAYFLDVRGLGESLPDEDGPFLGPYGMDYLFHGHGLMLGESYLGRRVHDLLCVLDLLKKEGAKDVRLYGRGQGAIIALFGALFCPAVSRVVLKNGPIACREWTQRAVVNWPAACFVRGMLKEFDLTDCTRALGSRVKLIEPWDSQMKPYAVRELGHLLRETGLSKRILADH